MQEFCEEARHRHKCHRVESVSSTLTGEDAIWFTDFPNNSIYTLDQLWDVFLAWYYLVSKKLNHKDIVTNFVALPLETISRSWDSFCCIHERNPKPPH